ncbi:hypothetical protein ACOMHN_042356 [Nucella lapillus]
MEQQVDFPTRQKKTFDLILTTHPSLKTRYKALPSVGNSDHDVVLYDTSLRPFRPKPPKRKILLWKKANVHAIRKDMEEYAQTVDIDTSKPDALETAWRGFSERVQKTINKNVPSKTTQGRYSYPWIDTSLRRAIRRKQRAHTKARKTGKKRDQDRYKRLQQEVKDNIKKASHHYLDTVVTDDFKTNSKKLWAYMKSKGQESQGVSPLKNTEGYLKSDNCSKAEILNNQFKSVFTEEDLSHMPDKGDSPYQAMDDITVTEKGVQTLLRNLQPNKATGPDSIPAFILKSAADEITPILTKMFQHSLDVGQVPTDWREAWVVPIFKKGDRHLPANYRPVSLTSIVCKVLEHIVHSGIMTHYDQHGILTDCQHGFRKKRSCETQLLATIHDITKSMAKALQVDVVLLDFSKAFDKVPHRRLLHKLHYYGVRSKTLRWTQAFLTSRTQEVILEGVHSSKAPVMSGVPQGTVLGPLLFLTYINDLPDVVTHSKTRLFADDSMLCKDISAPADKTKLQEDLDALEKWERTWQMHFNPSKCAVMTISGSRTKASERSYTLHNQVLENTKASKYLGVTLTDDMTWTVHTDGVAARGSRTVGFLRRNFSSCSTPVKAATYTTMIDINKLERVQRRAARYATNTYMEQAPGTVTTLLQDLRWDTLENRRSSTRLQMLYKINNKLVDLNKSHFYRQADGRTRGNRIYQERVNHPAHFNSFFPRTLRQWNTLPPSATSAPSLETFRARIGCSPHGPRPTSASP